MKVPAGWVLAGGAIAAVVVAVAAGLYVTGSPAEERARRMDERRVADLRAIKASADLFWTRRARLPVSLDDLAGEAGVEFNMSDPVTTDPYAYQMLDSARYELCATFERASGELSRIPRANFWAHGPGRQCFTLEARDIDRPDRRVPDGGV